MTERADSSTDIDHRVTVFDVCDTLYRSNTTADFVWYYGGRRGSGWVRGGHRAVTDRRSPVHWAVAAAYKGLGVDVGRAILVGLLRGAEREELYEVGRAFVDEYLAERRVEETHRRLREAIGRGDEVVLASTSIDPVVEAVAVAFDVEAISSRLAYDDEGRCLGRLEVDRTGRKLEPVRDRVGGEAELTVVTDNFSDRELLEAADRRVVVLRRERDRARWGELEAEYIVVD